MAKKNQKKNQKIRKLSKTKKLLKLALLTRPMLSQLHQVKLTNQKKIPLVLIIRQFEKYLSRILKIKKLNRLKKMLNLI